MPAVPRSGRRDFGGLFLQRPATLPADRRAIVEAIGRGGHAVQAVRVEWIRARLIDFHPAAVHGLAAWTGADFRVGPTALRNWIVAPWTDHVDSRSCFW